MKIICSVRDITADTYAAPFTSINAGTALRDFGHACRDPESQLAKSPAEFQLFTVGEFDDSTGTIVPHAPRLLANATQFAQE